MTQPLCKSDRTRLMLGCGSAAMALALALAPQSAAAQGVQATPTTVSGTANVTSPSANTTRIDVASQTAVIDWNPFVDNNGNALSFLPTGSTADFRGTAPGFAVLNRILPTTNNNIAVIDGTVTSQFGNPSIGFTTGGFIAFYSPTGILVGSNARFDVGSLLLTTLDITPTSFDDFANGGFLTLQGQAGSLATITVSPGAQISATQENSFFAIVAADIEMRGSALVNGSHAYVAGEVVNLRYSNGLFDISIPVGTAASGEVVTIDGTIAGPSSTGVGDNHMIYAVARASQDPISMLLRGNIGFAPAASAGVVNGEIILAANYNVSGRNVGGGAIGEDVDTVTFRRANATSDVRADITLQDFNASSSLLAIGTGRTLATSINANSSVTGNLMLVGRQSAALDAAGPRRFAISGDVLVDARDFGVVGSGLSSLDVLNAQGGSAQILARNPNAEVTIGGRAIVSAEAFGGSETLSRIAGTARGGTAEIVVTGGQVSVTGNTSVRASAFGTNFLVETGAFARGGTAQLVASNGGQATLSGDLVILANAIGAEGIGFGPSTASNAFGGTARLAIDGLGTIGIRGSATLSADAIASTVNAVGGGALADAGEASVGVDGNNLLTIDGALTLLANAVGGQNLAGTGGVALGGAARAITRAGGRMTVGGVFLARAEADGGFGVSGGNAFGGIAGANAITGSIAITGNALANTTARGGSAALGFGGDGGTGRGGYTFFQAVGAAGLPARLSIGGFADLRADGSGGNGGESDGQSIAAGRGGDGFGGDASAPNQADPAFRSGAFLLAGGDYGQIEVTGTAFVFAQGSGGRGGRGFGTGAFGPGRGGNGTGGLAQAGLELLGGPGTVGGGTALFADLTIDATGFGGVGGIDGFIDEGRGTAGDGLGGAATLSVRAGRVTASNVSVTAGGFGGTGGVGGNGTGGAATVKGDLGGRLTAAGLGVLARGQGGFALAGRGGNGLGGTATFEIDGLSARINGNLSVDASGSGSDSADGASGDGRGGVASIVTATPTGLGTLTVTGDTSVFANGLGAESLGSFAAGNGQGGLAYIDVQGGSQMTFATAQIAALGRGGEAALHEGGDGTGGTARLRAVGTGSRLTIQRNVPLAIATESPAGAALLSADGIGTDTFGGDGIGGAGRAGTAEIIAAQGGAIGLPVNILADPLRAADSLFIVARGRGGNTSVDGGTGGFGAGGTVNILVDGGTVTSGAATPAAFGQGGSAANSSLNITGGAASGGSQTIRVLGGGALTIQSVGGAGAGAGALGGNGSGTGNGGNATAGSALFEVINSVANLTGALTIAADATGGNGGATGAGGSGNGGTASLSLTGGSLTLSSGTALTIRANGTGGAGGTAGAGTGGQALMALAGNATLDADAVEINASGATSTGGTTRGGTASLQHAVGSTARLTANTLRMLADAAGGTVNAAGRFSAIISGGRANLASLTASATGNRLIAGLAASELAAVGGSLNVSGALNASAFGDILLRTGLGGVIGNAAAAGNTGAIQVDSAATVEVQGDGTTDSGLSGQIISLLAGRSILVGGTVTGRGGAITLTANRGGGQALASAPASVISMAPGSRINAGTGTVTMRLLGGAGDPQRVNGAVTLASITAARIDVRNLGSSAGSNIGVRADGVLTASGTGRAIDLASLNGEVINLAGDPGLVLTGGGHYAIFAATPTGSQIGSFANYARRYNVANAGAYDTLNPGGNFAAFRIVPFLTVSANPASRFYGSANPTFTASFAGFLPGDGAGNIAGTAQFTTLANATSNIGLFTIDAALGSLLSDQGYQFTFAPGVLNVTPRPLTVTANNQTRLYGNANPALTFTLGGLGLVNGDLLSGALATSAGTTTGVGNVAITQGTLAASANYALTFVGGQLAITPRLLTVSADSLTKLLGIADPALTFRLSGDGLVNGDTVSGVLVRDAGERPGVFAIRQGTLGAGPNYAITYIGGDLTINLPPTPPGLGNPTSFVPPIRIGDQPPPIVDEDARRFGIDFPEQLDAPLISENPLLDDPVTSGGDASVYGDAPPPAGERK